MTAAPRVLFVGELNPYGDDERFALWDEPAGASGDRLRRILGLSPASYRAQARANLCAGQWRRLYAMARAAELRAAHPAPFPIVLLGRKVAAAFGLGEVPPFSRTAERVFLLPHPSGLCQEWNQPSAVDRARRLLACALPDVGTAQDAAVNWLEREPWRRMPLGPGEVLAEALVPPAPARRRVPDLGMRPPGPLTARILDLQARHEGACTCKACLGGLDLTEAELDELERATP